MHFMKILLDTSIQYSHRHLVNISNPFPYRTIHFIALIFLIYKTQQHDIGLASANAKAKEKICFKTSLVVCKEPRSLWSSAIRALIIKEKD